MKKQNPGGEKSEPRITETTEKQKKKAPKASLAAVFLTRGKIYIFRRLDFLNRPSRRRKKKRKKEKATRENGGVENCYFSAIFFSFCLRSFDAVYLRLARAQKLLNFVSP